MSFFFFFFFLVPSAAAGCLCLRNYVVLFCETHASSFDLPSGVLQALEHAVAAQDALDVVFIRHGQSEANVAAEELPEHYDAVLTEVGREQAAAVNRLPTLATVGAHHTANSRTFLSWQKQLDFFVHAPCIHVQLCCCRCFTRLDPVHLPIFEPVG